MTLNYATLRFYDDVLMNTGPSDIINTLINDNTPQGLMISIY